MNLITDQWIPVMRQNGPDTIAPWQIAEAENPVLEIRAPRPDFQGALYQFLIGLLQTCFAPEDEDEWLEYWEKLPNSDELNAAFEKVKEAFELFNPEGPAFMQDYSLPDGENKMIAALLIEAPGGKTIKDNLDHFIKRGQICGLCPSCTAIALFTLQINAPSGGAGHRVGLRGGGPLTTLIMSEKAEDALWKKLWVNVLTQEEIPVAKNFNSSVMPWLGETRLSAKKADITTPRDVHALQMYWGMPRRIRLERGESSGVCDLCGEQSEAIFKNFRTKKHGTNYDGPWVHPLTPYRFDKEKKNNPLSLKGQKGGLGYRHWLGLALQDDELGEKAATVVRVFNEERGHQIVANCAAAIWCFGYDMDNMKARCWYDTHFPIFALDQRQKENVIDWASELVKTAREVVKLLRGGIKSAWFRRPEDAKGDMSGIDYQFWEETEADFYRILDQLANLPGETRMAPSEIYETWLQVLKKIMGQIFETNCFESEPEDLDIKRIVLAKQTLWKQFFGNKAIKNLIAKSIHEEAA
ncbi:MAG: type I-E CRISPR-associated protein Cse1/CasA [Desulfobulbaceae bacterium]|nr:type I-E CRISPR-associated protein Cse1/CasA [Desulfobulbaceae bacterium]